jgi:hypothetical protein
MFQLLQVLLTYQVIIYVLIFSRLCMGIQDYPQHWVVKVYRGCQYIAPHILNCNI